MRKIFLFVIPALLTAACSAAEPSATPPPARDAYGNLLPQAAGPAHDAGRDAYGNLLPEHRPHADARPAVPPPPVTPPPEPRKQTLEEKYGPGYTTSQGYRPSPKMRRRLKWAEAEEEGRR